MPRIRTSSKKDGDRAIEATQRVVAGDEALLDAADPDQLEGRGPHNRTNTARRRRRRKPKSKEKLANAKSSTEERELAAPAKLQAEMDKGAWGIGKQCVTGGGAHPLDVPLIGANWSAVAVGSSDGEVEAKGVTKDMAEYADFCDSETQAKNYAISTVTQAISELSADIEEGTAQIADYAAEIVAEWTKRFFDTELFFDKYAKGKFGNYFLARHNRSGVEVTRDRAAEVVEEAQLFIEACHACESRLVALQAISAGDDSLVKG